VTGRERLRRDGEGDSTATARAAAATARDEDTDWSELSDRTLATVSVRTPGARAPTVSARDMSAPNVDHQYELFRIRRDDERPRSGTRWLPWVVALAIGAGAAVYWNQAWFQEHGPEWIAIGRGVVDKVAQGKVSTAPRVASGPTASADDAAPSATPQLGNAAPASPAPQRASSGGSSSVAPPPKDSSPQAREASAPSKDASAQLPAPAASSSQATQVQQVAIAGEPAAPEIFEPEKSVVVVSEAAPSAAITIRRHGGLDASTSFVWWTSDGTAVADEDYVNLGARIEKLAVGEQTRTIYIPIVHDSKREGRESFYVNVRPGKGTRDDPAQRVEVVIEDDD